MAHEALIQGWPQLRRWIDADRAGLRIHRQLAEAAREWEANGRESSFLYGGTRLVVAQEWETTHRDELNALEAEFLAASVQQERKRRSDELEKQRRRIRTLRLLLLIAITLMGILVWALVKAETERAKAETERAKAETERANQVIARAEQMCLAKANEYREKILSLIKEQKINICSNNRLKLRQVVVDCMGDFSGFKPKLIDLNKTTGLVSTTFKTGDFLCAAISLKGGYLAVGTKKSSTIWMCDLSARDPRLVKHVCLPDRHGQLTCLAFNASGKRLAVGYSEKTEHGVSIWRVVDASKGSFGPEEGGVESRSGEVRGVAFSSDGKFLAVCSEGIAVFEILDRPGDPHHKDYRPYLTLGGDRSDFAEFSPDSELLAYTCAQRQEVRLWSVSTRRRVAILKHRGPVKAAMFSRDGRTLVVAGPQSIHLWNQPSQRVKLYILSALLGS